MRQARLGAQRAGGVGAPRQEHEREALPCGPGVAGATSLGLGRPRTRWQLKSPWRKLLLSTHLSVSLGLLTPWGIVRYWWVAISLALTGGGIVLGTVILVPTVGAAADEAAALSAGQVLSVDRLGLV